MQLCTCSTFLIFHPTPSCIIHFYVHFRAIFLVQQFFTHHLHPWPIALWAAPPSQRPPCHGICISLLHPTFNRTANTRLPAIDVNRPFAESIFSSPRTRTPVDTFDPPVGSPLWSWTNPVCIIFPRRTSLARQRWIYGLFSRHGAICSNLRVDRSLYSGYCESCCAAVLVITWFSRTSKIDYSPLRCAYGWDFDISSQMANIIFPPPNFVPFMTFALFSPFPTTPFHHAHSLNMDTIFITKRKKNKMKQQNSIFSTQ